ncbi:MAG: Ni/Fe hydrogenase subunit alpha [Deltaproteobacteria bacterium]|nr:Ni/Fe hydrogenase subunit alpha [Deltaproteobacteria bacterium]
MTKRITIDPITRLEGHGKIDIFLDGNGDVERAYLQIPDFKGFEKFCEGRAVEEMPTLTQKICGVCPTAHHTTSSKVLDDLFNVEPPPAGRKLRELMYDAFMFEDHLLHFYYLGGPDLIVGPDAPAAERNILGVIGTVGIDMGRKIIGMRNRVRGVIGTIGGSPLYPVNGLPGGVSRPMTREENTDIKVVAKDAIEHAKLTLDVFDERVLNNSARADLLMTDVYYNETYYMGLIDRQGKVNFYDGKLRVVDPKGEIFVEFEAREYLEHLEERVEPWSYMKPLYLKNVGWKGFTDGPESGIYRVGPLARFNVSDGMATPLAQAEYERMVDYFGGKPVHNIMAYHWARLIEVLYAAERMDELARDEEITSPKVRNLPSQKPQEGFGVCEAPRGTLFHHYETDERGIVRKLNLLVATQNSAAAICLSVEKAARSLIKGGHVSDDILNRVEMAFRAYDPCLACATHCVTLNQPRTLNLYDYQKKLIKVI